MTPNTTRKINPKIEANKKGATEAAPVGVGLVIAPKVPLRHNICGLLVNFRWRYLR